ncbi:MAG: PAS domain S-box protein [gamma proteobacterium symbiont of Taylorina sp.]|nr:PAS domain S-box protein [gamma proteobacterium symbiont of Taylorina sp.]
MKQNKTAIDYFFPGKSQSFIWHFLLFFIPAAIVLIIGISLHYSFHVKANKENLEKTDLLNIRLAQLTINNVLQDIVSDIKYLQEHNQLKNGFLNTPRARKILENDFLSFSRNRKIYDQIRYLDVEGKEIVRINFNNGHPIIVKEEHLQEKDNRYYVASTLALQKNDIYWSPFDLNLENNKIEKPYKPTIRIGTPVYNTDGHRTGVLILNFDGKKLINEFKRATANIADHIMLVNDFSYWLIHPQSKYEWGFMFADSDKATTEIRTFAQQFPELWQTIYNTQRVSQHYIDHDLLTYATIFFNTIGRNAPENDTISNLYSQQKKSFWKIIAFSQAKLFDQSHIEFLKPNALFYIIIFFVIISSSVLLARLQINKQKAESQGEYDRGFRNILESMDLIAITLDKEANVIFCNHSFIELSGYDKESVLNSSWFQAFIGKSERPFCQQKFAESFSTGISGSQREGVIIIKNGSKRLICWSTTLSYDNQNNPVSITYIGSDITEQRYTENELRKASQAIEQSPSTVLITDTSGKIVYTNPKFTELTGYSKEEVLGENPKILHSGETSTEEYNELWSALRSGKDWSGEFHNKKKNGELYWESAHISAIKDADGNITHYLAVKEDITEKKQLEEKVELHNEEIRKNQLLAGVGKMANMIAHDLRNPLSSIKMGMQILKNQVHQPMGEDGEELIDISMEQVHYMESILSDLLSFSRPDQLNTEWLSVDQLIDTSLVSVQTKIDSNQIIVKKDYQTGLPTIFADKTKLRQVFSNLIINALQAFNSQPGDKQKEQNIILIIVSLKITQLGPKLEIKIIDNGSGIDKETQEKVFEPFFTTKAKGTGLGLAIVQRIIEQHKGQITIHSMIEEGTEVTIMLPISTIESQASST